MLESGPKLGKCWKFSLQKPLYNGIKGQRLGHGHHVLYQRQNRGASECLGLKEFSLIKYGFQGSLSHQAGTFPRLLEPYLTILMSSEKIEF